MRRRSNHKHNHKRRPVIDLYELNNTIMQWPIEEIASWDFRQLLLYIYPQDDPRYHNALDNPTQLLELEHNLTSQTESKEDEEEKETRPSSSDLPPHAYYSDEEYLQSFHPWIYEEARALIVEGLQSPPLGSYKLNSRSTKQKRNFTEITFSTPIPPDIIHQVGTSDIVVQLNSKHSSEKILGIAAQQYDNGDRAGHIVRVSSIHRIKQKTHWTVTPLGSIATLRLTHSGLRQLEKTPDNSSCYNNHSHPSESPEDETKREEPPQPLNQKQQEFVDCATHIVTQSKSKGLEPILLEGPPGTGKTTTVLAFLDALSEKRVLVCAPSNTAVALLALRYYKMHPTKKIILLGQHDKLINDSNRELENIFLDSRLKEFHSTATAATEILNNFIKAQNSPDEEDLPEKIQELMDCYENLLQQLKQIDPENIHCTTEKSIIEFLENNNLDMTNALTRFIVIPMLRSMFLICNTLQDADLINNADMIFCTLTTTASRLKAMKDVDVVVIDEAGQATEAQSLIPLILHPKVLVLAGDIHQLEATVSSKNLNDINKSGYQRSLMARLLDNRELSSFMLTVQYRMHEDICALPSRLYYDGQLTPCDDIISGQREVPYPNSELLAPYCFVDITRGREAQQKKGQPHIRENLTEAYYIARFMYHLKHNLRINLSDNVCIITFYSDQVLAIQGALKGQEITEVIDIATVDSFQGGERNIVILSCVRSNDEGNLGFLANEHRLNVAITRARHALLIFGDVSTLENGTSNESTREDGLTDFHDLIDDARERDCLMTNSQLKEQIQDTPDQKTKIKRKKRKNNNKNNNNGGLLTNTTLFTSSRIQDIPDQKKKIKRKKWKKREDNKNGLLTNTALFPPPGLPPPSQGLLLQPPGLPLPPPGLPLPPPGLAEPLPPHTESQRMVGPPPGFEPNNYSKK